MQQRPRHSFAGELPDSQHLRAAQAARRRTPWWLAVLLTLTIFFVGALISVVTLELPDNASVITTALFFLPVLVVAYGLRILLVWLWVARYERRSFRTLGFPRGDAVLALRGAAVGLVILGSMVGLIAAFGGVSGRPAVPGFSGLAALPGVIIVLVGWTVQSSTEEILYRGFALQALGRYRVWIAVVGTALIFVFVHSSAFGNPLAMVNLFLAGVMFALYALREGGLWGVCGLHAVFNWGQNSVFGFSVSGQEIPGGSLWALQTEGSTLLSGGTFGIEASIPGSIVLLTVIIILLALPNRQSTQLPSRDARVTT